MIRPVNKNGFTLIELLIAMAIASIIMGAVFSVFIAQVRGQVSQDISLDMIQGARAALDMMADEIRMANCDPTQGANARIITASAGELIFSLDVDDDAETNQPDGDYCDGNEVIRYHLTRLLDADNNGVNDNIASGVACNLCRETGAAIELSSPCPTPTKSGLQQFALNIDALDFVYLGPDTDGDGEPDILNPLRTAVPAADLNDIRCIEVTLVARGGLVIPVLAQLYTNNNRYWNQQGDAILPAQKDRFRRLRLTTTITVRN